MRFFIGLIDPNGQGISDSVRRKYESVPRNRGLEFTWQSFDHGAVLTAWDDPWGAPLVARDGDQIAIGLVRLDNRNDVEDWTNAVSSEISDLALMARTVRLHGTKYIPQVLGDFAFATWHDRTSAVLSVTDAVGTKRLYSTERDGLIAFSSRAEPLADGDDYDTEYLAELVGSCLRTQELTVYKGVRRVRVGTINSFHNGKWSTNCYWSPDNFPTQPFSRDLEHEAPKICRQLLAESILQRLSPNGDTWAQLSGGLDSSSIVSMAQYLGEHRATSNRLSGTVSYVDWLHTSADERRYSDAVASRWNIRNEQIIEPPFWIDDDQSPPPRLDQPFESLAHYPRERRLRNIVRGAGGRVLLSGVGSDELFTGTTFFFADWLSQGRVLATTRELARWAAIGRMSFWDLALGNAIMPLVPPALRRSHSYNEGRFLPWLSPGVIRTYNLGDRTFMVGGNRGRIGTKYWDALATCVTAVGREIVGGSIADSLEVRYPFCCRPLVEFALTLPPELCARPRQRKWVLREAMRDILPEVVRTRVGKGAPTDVLVRSLTAQRTFLEPLMQHPILEELGVIDARSLRRAFEAAPLEVNPDRDLSTEIQCVLMTEAWLRIRANQWPPSTPTSGSRGLS